MLLSFLDSKINKLLLDESSEKKVRFSEGKTPWPTPDPSLVIHPVNKPPHQRLDFNQIFYLSLCIKIRNSTSLALIYTRFSTKGREIPSNVMIT